MIVEEGKVVRCNVNVGIREGDEHRLIHDTVCRSFEDNTAGLNGRRGVLSSMVEKRIRCVVLGDPCSINGDGVVDETANAGVIQGLRSSIDNGTNIGGCGSVHTAARSSINAVYTAAGNGVVGVGGTAGHAAVADGLAWGIPDKGNRPPWLRERGPVVCDVREIAIHEKVGLVGNAEEGENLPVLLGLDISSKAKKTSHISERRTMWGFSAGHETM